MLLKDFVSYLFLAAVNVDIRHHLFVIDGVDCLLLFNVSEWSAGDSI